MSEVPRFGRLEIDARVATKAEFTHWPYDAAPPRGVPAGRGVSVEAEFVDPGGRHYRQPAFQYQRFEDAVHDGRDWHHPTADFTWKVRFTPNVEGQWRYRLTMADRDRTAQTSWRTVRVGPSTARGFVRVSRADPR